MVIGGLLLAGMVAAAGYAALTLPAGARVPLNAGVPSYSAWLPKAAGLAAWLGAGVVTFAAFAALTLSGPAANWATSLRVVLLPCAMLIVLAAEAGAVITARQRVADLAEDRAEDRVEGVADDGAEDLAADRAEGPADDLADDLAEQALGWSVSGCDNT